MPRSRPSFVIKALTTITASLVLAAAAAASFKSGSYHGSVKPGSGISFSVAGGKVHNLDLRINDSCPDGRTLIVHAFHFPDIAINSRANFGGKFGRDPKQPTSIHGHLSGKKATGTITDTSRSDRTHLYCHGSATFSASTS